jgi:hypothetical protein
MVVKIVAAQHRHTLVNTKLYRAQLAVVAAATEIFDPADHGEPSLAPEWKRLDKALLRIRRIHEDEVKRSCRSLSMSQSRSRRQ